MAPMSNAGDGDIFLFEDFQHADMSDATGEAAAEG
jgi:hypothetical protein